MAHIRKRVGWAFVIVVVVLVAIRLALPFAIKHYINRDLKHMAGYTGEINGVSLHLWRGAYQIHGLRLLKSNGKVPIPFVRSPLIDISVQWHELVHGELVGELTFYKPELNFVSGASKEDTQEKPPEAWQDKVKKLSPFRINRVRIADGEIHYRTLASDPKVDVYLKDVNVTAENLSNAAHAENTLPATVVATGHAMNKGTFDVHAKLDPFATYATFDLSAKLNNLDLTEINDFLRAYGNFDVHAGRFDFITEVASNDGKYRGYAKPFFYDMDIVKWKEDVKEGKLHAIWQAIVAGVATLLKSKSTGEIATRVPFSGDLNQKNTDVLAAVGNLLKNAFIRALVPNLEHSVKMPKAS